MLDGEVTFWLGDERRTASAGDFVFVPRGAVHTFRVGAEGARMLNVVSPAGLETFIMDLGEPAPEATVPPPSTAGPDVPRIVELSAAYGAEVVGPPPTD